MFIPWACSHDAEGHFFALRALANKRVCAKYANLNALADQCQVTGYIVGAFFSFILPALFVHAPTRHCAMHATTHTFVSCMKHTLFVAIYINGVHIRLTFYFSSRNVFVRVDVENMFLWRQFEQTCLDIPHFILVHDYFSFI